MASRSQAVPVSHDLQEKSSVAETAQSLAAEAASDPSSSNPITAPSSSTVAAPGSKEYEVLKRGVDKLKQIRDGKQSNQLNQAEASALLSMIGPYWEDGAIPSPILGHVGDYAGAYWNCIKEVLIARKKWEHRWTWVTTFWKEYQMAGDDENNQSELRSLLIECLDEIYKTAKDMKAPILPMPTAEFAIRLYAERNRNFHRKCSMNPPEMEAEQTTKDDLNKLKTELYVPADRIEQLSEIMEIYAVARPWAKAQEKKRATKKVQPQETQQ
ncbi:hypothetical protein BDW69DRAFT_186836 [Aspergillus filifer]